jgi:hypothetical protein
VIRRKRNEQGERMEKDQKTGILHREVKGGPFVGGGSEAETCTKKGILKWGPLG